MDGPVFDVLRAAVLIGLAFLAWREFKLLRADIAERKRRKTDDSPQD